MGQITMDPLFAFLSLTAIVLGLLGVVLPLLPGTPLIFAGMWLAAWADGYTRIGVGTLLVLGALGFLGWLVDYVAAIAAVRRAGASQQAMGGAGLGSVAGLFGGLPGLILGPMLGALLGEWVARKDPARAARAGVAAGFGFVLALIAKIVLGLLMVIWFGLAWFIG